MPKGSEELTNARKEEIIPLESVSHLGACSYCSQ